MAVKKPFTPNLKTPPADFAKEELNKLASHGFVGNLYEEFHNALVDVTWESEALAKSHGVYLEFDRAKTGEEKDFRYMIRITNPGGGIITPEQWALVDELSEQYTASNEGHTSIRLTNRQTIQLHWVSKKGMVDIIKRMAEAGKNTLNGCGDNTRNVMACPLSRFSDVFNANELSWKLGEYFQLPLDPFIKVFEIDTKFLRKPEQSFEYGPNLLNRKFKIALSTLHRDPLTGNLIADNCVEMRTHDLGAAPIANDKGIVDRFQIYVGGGQGEKNGKPSLATLSLPLGIVSKDNLLKTMDAVVKVHQEWGDRQNRHWARLKYVIKKQGVPWYRNQVEARLGFKLEDPDPNHDHGDRHLHFGWTRQPSNKLWTYGAFIENGRIMDASPNGKLKTMVREIVKKYKTPLMITPNQDLLFTDLSDAAKKDFEADLATYGFGRRNGKIYSALRLHSGACVGRDTCRLTYTDSEKFEPFLIDDLEKMGWGDLAESIGITGCERQCFRPGTKTIGLVGSGVDRYMFKLFGDETGRFQGVPLISRTDDTQYLRSVPREKVPVVIDALFKDYKHNAKSAEGLGAYLRRIGPDAVIAYLKINPATAGLMLKPVDTGCVMDPNAVN